MYEHWVIDASVSDDGLLCYCPLVGDPRGEFSVIDGLSFISTEPPSGRCVGVVHPDGREAVEAWCEAHPDVMAALASSGGVPNGDTGATA